MKPSFWRRVWDEQQIGFHRSDIHPALKAWWPSGRSDDVLVPLCGKTLDMHWLAEQGHAVTGIELDERAIQQFFDEWSVVPDTEKVEGGLTQYQAHGITLLGGDFFAWRPREPFRLFYDRAALVALPQTMRRDYLAHLASAVAPGGEGLLLTFEYPEHCMDGPPCTVPEAEVRDQPWFDVELLAREDVLESHSGLKERGVTELHEVAYWLRRRG